ncbi:MAG: class I SAM-dependent methyltransferase [Bacteroidales bacterium]|jgi:2-polyprenyl-3-methyl-5-hydroxy-6-metoxy-1,4-benzoquinol methylase|nr:class I SAM-dependent methyltransferase [Bacteroidales bacterium]
MNYDPIKYSLGKVFNNSPILRKLFYALLNLLLLRAWYIRRTFKQWARTAPANARVLDAGAGYGQYVYFMSQFSSTWRITGVDMKTEQIADCNQFFKKIGKSAQVQFVEGDLTQFTAAEMQDFILCVDVMEHIENDTQVFRNFYQSLTNGGVLLISTPSDKGGSDVHEHGEESFVGEHVRDGYNIHDIQEKLAEAGFSHISAQYSYGTLGALAWKLSMKFPILMLNCTKLLFVVLPLYYCIVFPFCLLFNYIDVRSTHKQGTGLIVQAIK